VADIAVAQAIAEDQSPKTDVGVVMLADGINPYAGNNTFNGKLTRARVAIKAAASERGTIRKIYAVGSDDDIRYLAGNPIRNCRDMVRYSSVPPAIPFDMEYDVNLNIIRKADEVLHSRGVRLVFLVSDGLTQRRLRRYASDLESRGFGVLLKTPPQGTTISAFFEQIRAENRRKLRIHEVMHRLSYPFRLLRK
jgi:hypothetical protein